jgi:hypothetical protein
MQFIQQVVHGKNWLQIKTALRQAVARRLSLRTMGVLSRRESLKTLLTDRKGS